MAKKIAKKVVAVFFTDGHLSKENIEQNLSIHRQVIDFAKENELEQVFDGGDDFESRKSQPLDVLDGYAQQLGLFNEHGIEKCTIPGNHDKVDYKSEKSYLDIFRHFPKFKLFRKYNVVYLEGGILLHLIPYFEEDTVYMDYLQEAIEMVEKNVDLKHILFTHVAVSGVHNNDGSEVQNYLKGGMFGKFDKVFVGHYHNRSQVGDNIFYIGSVAPKNYGENNDKGICVLYSDLTHEYVSLKFKPYHTIQLNIDEINAEKIDELIKTYSDIDGYVRFELTGSKSKIESFDQNRLKSKGFDVKLRHPDIEEGIRKAEKKEFVSYNASSIIKEFKEAFCKTNKITDNKVGLEYLTKIIKKNGQE